MFAVSSSGKGPLLKRRSSRTLATLGYLGLVGNGTALALDPTKAITQYVHDVWQAEDGLPQNTVYAIVQTRDGYLWLGTAEGLARFDGVRFTVFDTANTPPLRSNIITALYEDHEGKLWIGTHGGGISRYENGRFRAFEGGLSNSIVWSIAESRQGALWIATRDGLYRLQDEKLSVYSTREGLPSNIVHVVYEDRSGTLWVGTDRGVSQLKGDRFAPYAARGGPRAESVESLYEDRRGSFWMGGKGALYRRRHGRWTSYALRDGSTAHAPSLHEDKDGNLWVGTRGGGLYRWDGRRFTEFTTKHGLSNDRVWDLSEDREGNLWIGTDGGGLNRLKDGRMLTYSRQEGLPSDLVASVYEDGDGHLWLGTYAGELTRWTDGRFTGDLAKGLPKRPVWAIHQDRQRRLWVGTNGGGLRRLERGKWALQGAGGALASDTVAAVLEDRRGDLWVGTAAGLHRLRQGKVTRYTTQEGLSHNNVVFLHEDREGSLWIGTWGGLNRLRDGRLRTYGPQEGLSHASVMCVYEDPAGDLWIGTYGGGLNRFRSGAFTTYRKKDGLFDDVVYRILEDGSGNLWMSSNKGIFRVSKSELNDFAEGKVRAISAVSYGKTDGMESVECNGGTQNAGGKTRDGRLWFPTLKGVVVIDPERARLNPLPPPVLIEQISSEGKGIQPRESVKVGPGRGALEFHYTALSLVAPEKVRFKYRLQGFDKDWIDAGGRRVAYYTNLPPGTYRFEVIACNNDGLWNETGASLELHLEPYFHQTYWFYALCGTVVGLMGWGLHRLRVKQVAAGFSAVLAERSRMAREIHDTLAQGFAGISVHLEAVAQSLPPSTEKAKEHLDRARGLVRSSLAEARRSIWELRPQALEHADLATALADVARQLTGGTPTEVEVHVSGPRRPLSGVVENNLLRIGQEALTNAVRHGQPRRIRVELEMGDREVRLRVLDDGRGLEALDPSATSEGHFGLLGMRERAEQMGGRLNLHTRGEGGTEVTVVVPTR